MTKTDKYIESVEKYRDALRNALEIADDPYKPPEITVATGKSVVFAAWEMQIQYAALVMKDE